MAGFSAGGGETRTWTLQVNGAEQTLTIVDPRDDELWQRLSLTAAGSLFSSPPWIRAVSNTYGFEPAAAVLLEDGEPVAGMPYCRVSDLRGPRVVGFPFSDYCDPIVTAQDQWDVLSEAMLSLGDPVHLRTLSDMPSADERFSLKGQEKWHGVELEGPLEDLWNGLDGSARRAIRKARDQGVEVAIHSQPDGLRAFYSMHLQNRKRKYRLLTQPFNFFEELRREFGDDLIVLLAEHNSQIIAGIMFLIWRDTIYYKFNASLEEHLGLRPNDLLAWSGIELGYERDMAQLDFGLSDSDQPGLIRYKRKYATSERTIHSYRSAEAPDPTSGLLSEVTYLFTDESVPDAVTEAAGELLYHLFC